MPNVYLLGSKKQKLKDRS